MSRSFWPKFWDQAIWPFREAVERKNVKYEKIKSNLQKTKKPNELNVKYALPPAKNMELLPAKNIALPPAKNMTYLKV